MDFILAFGLDPLTLAVISASAMAAGAGVQAYGIRKRAKAESKIYKHNASIDRRDAEQRRISSMEEQQILRERMRKHLEKHRATEAKSGFMMSGTPLEEQLKIAEVYATDIGMMALGAETEARSLEQRAGISRYRAGYATQAGRIGVGSALLGGAGSIASLGMEYNLNNQTSSASKWSKSMNKKAQSWLSGI